MGWAQRRYGAGFAAWLGEAHEPIDPVVRLAPRTRASCSSTAAASTVRSGRCAVSLANLDDDCYLAVGGAIRRVFDGYVAEWQAAAR